jgi:endonuclease G
VYVFTGPVYSAGSGVIGAGRVAVPSYLYKLVYDATTGRSWVHWQANNRDAKAGPPISYEEFAERTGLKLLPMH